MQHLVLLSWILFSLLSFITNNNTVSFKYVISTLYFPEEKDRFWGEMGLFRAENA